MSFEAMARDGGDRPQLQGGRGGNEGVNVLGDSFGDWVGTGFRKMVNQRSGGVGEGIEFGDGEGSFCERASFVKEDRRCVPSVLDRLGGLVTTEYRAELNKAVENGELCATHLEQYPLLRSDRHRNENHHWNTQ